MLARQTLLSYLHMFVGDIYMFMAKSWRKSMVCPVKSPISFGTMVFFSGEGSGRDGSEDREALRPPHGARGEGNGSINDGRFNVGPRRHGWNILEYHGISYNIT